LETATRDQVDGAVESVAEESLRVASVVIEDVDSFGYQPLIDEPVTGSGNDDLWVPDCPPTKDGDCPAPASAPGSASSRPSPKPP